MKWVPVNKSEEPAKQDTSKPTDGSCSGEGRTVPAKRDLQGKGDSRGAGKSEIKGSGKSTAKGAGKSEAKGAGKADKTLEAAGDRSASKGEAKGGKADPRIGGKAASAKGDIKGAGKNEGGFNEEKEDAKAKSEPKGGKGRGERGKGKAAGKSKGSRKGTDDAAQSQASGVKTVQEVEADLAKNQASRPLFRRSRGADAVGKQPIEVKGEHCLVRKHSAMGCCVVSMESNAAREVVMLYVEKKFPAAPGAKPKMEVSGVTVQMQRHLEKGTQREVVTDIFVAWGHRAEKESPLAVDEIAEAFDKLYEQANASAANVPKGAQAPPPAVTQPPATGTLSGGLPGTLSTTPQQLLGRPPAVPPPPMHLPTVGTPAAAAPQAPVHPGYCDYAQRAAMFNNWMVNPTMNQYFPQQQQQQQVAHQLYAQQHQQAAAAALDYQRHLHQLQQQQQQQLQQQQQQLQPLQPLQPPQPLQPLQLHPLPQQQQAGQPATQQSAHQPAPQQPPQQRQLPLQQLHQAQQAPQLRASQVAPGEDMLAGGIPARNEPDPLKSSQTDEDYAPAKPRLLPIVDPSSGQIINTLSMNFEPRKPSSPLKIINPCSGEAVGP